MLLYKDAQRNRKRKEERMEVVREAIPVLILFVLQNLGDLFTRRLCPPSFFFSPVCKKKPLLGRVSVGADIIRFFPSYRGFSRKTILVLF
jgi:hypothetical protein